MVSRGLEPRTDVLHACYTLSKRAPRPAGPTPHLICSSKASSGIMALFWRNRWGSNPQGLLSLAAFRMRCRRQLSACDSRWMDRESNPKERLSLVSLAGRCRHQIGLPIRKRYEWDLNPRKMLPPPSGFKPDAFGHSAIAPEARGGIRTHDA